MQALGRARLAVPLHVPTCVFVFGCQDSVILFDHPRAIPAAIASLPLEAVGAAAVRFAQGAVCV
eukprot:2073025-Rhodomonas_salina.1